jgi:hypothetical protein
MKINKKFNEKLLNKVWKEYIWFYRNKYNNITYKNEKYFNQKVNKINTIRKYLINFFSCNYIIYEFY